MALMLYDAHGELTRWGAGLRICALLVGILSGLALLPLTSLVFLSPMLCDAGCTGMQGFFVQLLWLLPLLLLMSAAAGVVGFKQPSWGMIVLALLPIVPGVLLVLPSALT